MKNAIHSLLVTLISVTAALLCSCGNVENIKQNVSGSPGEIIVVINAGEWESEVGEILRNDLEAEYQVLPQIEPKFKLYNINPDNFSSLFWIHRNILIVNISPDVKENKTLITKDVWARPQIVAYVNAASDSALLADMPRFGTQLANLRKTKSIPLLSELRQALCCERLQPAPEISPIPCLSSCLRVLSATILSHLHLQRLEKSASL